MMSLDQYRGGGLLLLQLPYHLQRKWHDKYTRLSVEFLLAIFQHYSQTKHMDKRVQSSLQRKYDDSREDQLPGQRDSQKIM